MVMTLCLLVYASIEHKIREKLCKNEKKFLDPKKKPTQNPTAHWIFFCFLGLHVMYVDGEKREVTHLKSRHPTISHCFALPHQRIYYSELWG